jgi:hypothetical protein
MPKKNLKLANRIAAGSIHRLDVPTTKTSTESWWLGAETREEFVTRHRQQLARINETGFGRRHMLVTPPSGG